jgi:Ethylbenzene dehydrogenase
MFIGPPIEPSEAQVAGTERYSAGYLPDPGQPIYVYNYKARPGQGYDGVVDIDRLPIDYSATMAAMKTIPDSPNTSNDEGAIWWLTNETSVPYSKELDDQIPVGTIVPGVLNINEYQGDRADIKGGAAYADGHWTVEASRKLVTGSKYDTTFEKGKKLYLYVSAFDHVQTRHTRHERPIVMELK